MVIAMSKFSLMVLVMVAAVAAPGTVLAKNDGGLLDSLIAPRGNRPAQPYRPPAIRLDELLFGARDRQIIANFFLRNPGYFDYLPSGLRRQLVTKGLVPREVSRQPLPDALARRLAPLPDGYERTIVGPDVLLIEARSGLIIDIVRDVVR